MQKYSCRAPIRNIAQQAIETGCLTIEAEEQLRLLLQTTKYGQDDLNAFMKLQQAAMEGFVQQQSIELRLWKYGVIGQNLISTRPLA